MNCGLFQRRTRRGNFVLAMTLFAACLGGLGFTRFYNQGCQTQGYPVIYLSWPPILRGGGAINGGMYVNPNCPDPGCPDESERDAIVRAMATWNDAPFNFTFVFAGDTTRMPYDGTYDIDLSDNVSVTGWNHIDGPSGLLARTWVFFECWGEIVETDIEFDEYQNWVAEGPVPSGAFDVESVALHELGHVLGLNHSVAPAVMQPYLFSGERRVVLTQDDIDGGLAIYGPEPSGVEGFDSLE